MEQLSVSRSTQIYLPTSHRVMVSCRVPLSAKQEHNIIEREDSWSLCIYNRDGSSAAGRWVAAAPVDKCRSDGYGTAHTRPSQPIPCQAGSSSPSHTRCRTDGRVHSCTCATIDPAGAEPRNVCVSRSFVPLSLSPRLSRFADRSVRRAGRSTDARQH